MSLNITHFINQDKRFDELLPLLMRCFPDFWGPRLKQDKKSFPYDVHLYTAYLESQMIGCIGIHHYPFFLNTEDVSSYGVSDVAVDPDFRGKGYAREMLNFVLDFVHKNTTEEFLPLYTDKPGVYTGLGWQVYESDRSTEISIRDFPKGKTFRFEHVRDGIIHGYDHSAPTPEEQLALEIILLYVHQAHNFCGKCSRSAKTWIELLTDPEYEWQYDGTTCFLYRGDELYEAYSKDPNHPVTKFTPKHGGHDSNKVMVKLSKITNRKEEDIAAAIDQKRLVFPAADVF